MNKYFDKIFKELNKKSFINISQQSAIKLKIKYSDLIKSCKELVILGFANKTKYFNGKKEIHITEKGKIYYKIFK